MRLYVIRHAHALPVTVPGVDADENRPLSEEGRQQVQALITGFQKLGVTFDKLMTSPLARARQTADALAKGLSLPEDRVVAVDPLEPGGSAKKLAKMLRKVEGEHVGIVGHEPELSRFTAWLIGSKRAQLDLAKAGVACLICDGPPAKGAACLTWLVSPAWMSGLATSPAST